MIKRIVPSDIATRLHWHACLNVVRRILFRRSVEKRSKKEFREPNEKKSR